jgi:hypothetical protein
MAVCSSTLIVGGGCRIGLECFEDSGKLRMRWFALDDWEAWGREALNKCMERQERAGCHVGLGGLGGILLIANALERCWWY